MIRAMRQSDCTAIAALEAANFDSAFTSEQLSHLMDQLSFCGFVADHAIDPAVSDQINGYIIGHIVADQAEILTFAVQPAFRGQGRGRALLGQFLHQARQRGVIRVMLEVAADNAAAQALYAAHGFIRSGVRPAYYKRPDGRCDAIMMAYCFTEAFS